MCGAAALGAVALSGAGGAHAAVPAEPACAACPAIVAQARTDAERPAASALCERLVGGLVELGRYRAAFDERPRYIDLFPTIYWNITEATVRDAAAGRFAHPIAAVADMAAFLDAYEVNRARWDADGTAEPHWAAHYRLAADADRDFAAIGQGAASETPDAVEAVLGSAIRAHVAYDLPRALRATFQARLDPSLSEADLHTDFLRIDTSIEAAQQPSEVEISAAIAAASTWDKRLMAWAGADWMRALIIRETHSVLEMRRDAWRAAFADASLPTGDAPQPRGDAARLEAEGRAACAAAG